ncbi:MAG: phosphate signaling complex protein PhoU [Pelagimonas sp.]|uniref:phosphate signaling complex protein PhoU n=1 Tax=Pelagimonas sp. TaxID=2073170 RepID=UPI003D6BEE6C
MTELKNHIVTSFDRDLEGIQAQIMKMGGLVEASIMEAATSLETRDVELAEKVRKGDKVVDALEEVLNDEAAQVIALRAPTASDLRVVLSVMRMSANLERIGDLSKNIAKRTDVLVQVPPVGDTATSLRRMAREVELMLKDALDAYIQRDDALALDVIARDEDVDKMHNTLFRELLTYMLEDPGNITACMHLHFIAKNIERMGDHVTSIAEQVVFMATGSIPHGDRNKSDETSSELGPQHIGNGV